MTFERARRPWSVRLTFVTATVLVLGAAMPVGAADPAPEPGAPSSSSPKSAHSKAVHHDTSPALRDIEPAELIDRFVKKKRDRGTLPLDPTPYAPDGVTQAEDGAAATAGLASSFDGVGVGMTGYSVRWAPPDTAGAIGPEHFMEIVNTDFAIFAKDGTVVLGPLATNTVWSGFGGSCQDRNDGDGTVEYDSIAGRWVISQFAIGGPPYYQCVAVSVTGDPTGAYHRYAFQYQDFPDYPKLGVWPDAYYTTFNMFRTGFAGAWACAYDRAAMLEGFEATQQCVNLGIAYASLLPADLDGSTPPPVGAPNYLLNIGSGTLRLWKFDVDWAIPANTRLTGPISVTGVAPFSTACSGGACIPQPGTAQRLASLGDRLMYRLAYRNFGTHESLVVNHSIKTGALGAGPTGVRWYEVRLPGGNPAVYQQGTYAPDSTYRWMGSAAMDGAGNLAVGYSASSATVKPSLRWAGRLASDPLNTLGQGETEIVTGTGVQLPNLDRWGDYTALSVDPVDDCTFWFVGQYLKTDGAWNWSTRVASWSMPGCIPEPPPPPDVIAPTIDSYMPEDLALDVPRSANVTVTFSEPMNTTSAKAAFSLLAADGAAVAGSFSWSGTTMTFNPSADLAAGATYAAKVGIGATDSAGNALLVGEEWSFTTVATTAYNAAPNTVTRETGTLKANGVAQLAVSDNARYELNSARSGGNPTTSWYGSFTGVSNALANLKVTFEGHHSRTATQTVSIWRWTTNSWVQLDTRSVGTSDVTIANVAPTGALADYVSGDSGSGELRIRVRATRNSNNFYSAADLLRIVYDAP